MLCFRGLEKFSTVENPSGDRISAKDVFVLTDRDGDSFRGSGVRVLRLRGLRMAGDIAGPARGGNGWPGTASGRTVGDVLDPGAAGV